MIKLFDRIKEISHSTGTGVFNLDGAAAGFSAFNTVYSNGDVLFYAITDGTRYEVGSGVYSSNQLTQRYPFSSTNSNNRVNFPNGVKEVYVAYPGKYSVYTASGYSDFQQPQNSGLAFWRNSNTLDYDPNLIWDKDGNLLGISKKPEWPLDVGGIAKASGLIVDRSGVWFSGVNIGYAMGVQLEPFLKNVLNVETGTDAVFQLSGIVNQGWLFKKQDAGTFFAGPPSGCGSPPCPDDYPSFRGITVEDVPDLSDLYVVQYGDGVANNIAFYRQSGVIEYDAYLTWDKTNNYLGVNKTTPNKALDVVGEGKFTSRVDIGAGLGVSGDIITQSRLHFASGNPASVGLLSWDDGDGTLNLGLKGGNVGLSIGQSNIALCYNDLPSTLNKGQVVYVSGAQGQRPLLGLAVASGEFTSSKTFGVVIESISNGAEGFIGTFGLFRNLNTSSFDSGSGLWLSATTPGAMTMVRPQAPNHGVFIGYCVRKHASAGEIFVNIQNGYEIDELHNVLIQSVASGDFLQYDSSLSVWRNRPVSALNIPSGWTISDTQGNSEYVGNDTVYFSGVNGISTNYNTSTNVLQINPASLSGYFESKIAAIGSPSPSGWTVSDAQGNSEYIVNDIVYFSGVKGVSTSYNPSTNVLQIDPTSISGYFENKINGIGATTYTAGSGLTLVGSQFNTAGTGNFTQIVFGANTNPIAIGSGSQTVGNRNINIGHTAGCNVALSGISIGFGAGSGNVGYTFDTISIGTQSAQNTVNTSTGIFLGVNSAKGSENSWNLVSIGTNAGNASLYAQNTVFLGSQAGLDASGNSSNRFAFNIGIGNQALKDSKLLSQMVAIGAYAGSGAGNASTVTSDSNFIGTYAGLNSDSSYSTYLGNYAGQNRTSNNNFIVKTTSSTSNDGAVWAAASDGSIISISDTIMGRSDTRTVRIGASGTYSEVDDATLSLKSNSASVPTLSILRSTSQQTASQLIADSGNSNTIVNASGFLTIPVFNTFCAGYNLIGSGASYNKGVIFFAADSGRLYISSGSGWLYSSFTTINEQCGGGTGGGIE